MNGVMDPAALVGAPWLRGGRDPLGGIDCWGVVLLCIPGVPDYAGDAQARMELAVAFAKGWRDERWRRLAAPRDRCLVMLEPTHAGVFWRGYVVHATRADGVRADPASELSACGFPSPTFMEWRP
ncbi:hypothetical protein P2H44_06340 [Albimonas sp. CAU 1670]|uniref:hypothetical protein n=1 Tax=Albimonas sp. CAU 1670 TaxID=3032599 RepID=UPI0023DB0231|nr:hypothetical protein [Albimonas sp. CAU 1670]MDF2232168.1 hypothetical protein [Albimonas sp. CAU 1670]